MEILKNILFWHLMMIAVSGVDSNANTPVNEQESHVSMDHSWETQRFLHENSVVEGESDMGEFIALRERRNSEELGNDERNYDRSGSGDICKSNEHDCHQNATCTSDMNNRDYNCTCNPGFSGDGKNCDYIGDCSADLCSPNARCNNTLDSFKCACKEEFYGDGATCTEIRRYSSSRNVYIKPGEPAVLVCSLNETVQWKKDGKILVDNENIKIFQNVLVVTSKDNNDYGKYFCELTNYKGKGIKMTLFKVNEDTSRGEGGSESKTYLILFIVALILLVFALFVMSYLLLRRKPNLTTAIRREATAKKNNYGEANEAFVMPHISSGEIENYNSLDEIRDEEPTYQGLIPKKDDKDPESLYEDIPTPLGKQNASKNEHVYAEPIESSLQGK